MDRRTFLGAGARAAAALGTAKALTNTVVGYGEFGIGDNLVDDPPTALVTERFPIGERFHYRFDDWQIRIENGHVEATPAATGADSTSEPPERVSRLADSIEALNAGRFAVTFHGVPGFFDLLQERPVRPDVVGALRARHAPVPAESTVGQFAGCDPADVRTLVGGLATGFARATSYDAGRYVAGSIDDNLLPFHANLRSWLQPTYSFDTLVDDEGTSLFCGEYTLLANRAFRAVAPAEQRPPITGLRVVDRRHKHVYNGLASVIDTDDGLTIPITFVDYTYTTLYADLHLEGVLGDGLDAYDHRHRADQIWW